MSSPYRYEKIGDALVERLTGDLDRGTSFVIIGPRGCGKRYLIDSLPGIKDDKENKENKIPKIALPDGETMERESDFAMLLCDAMDLPLVESVKNWAEEIERGIHLEEEQTPYRLAVTNLDALANVIAFRFLRIVQRLMEARKLIIWVTGEANLLELVGGGPNSPWNCSMIYVVNAHDESHFHGFVTKRLEQANLTLPEGEERKEILDEFYRLTGGNVSLARAVIWSRADRLNHHLDKSRGSAPFVDEENPLPECLSHSQIIPTAGLTPFAVSVERVLAEARESFPPPKKGEASFEAIRNLDSLLQDEEVVLFSQEPHLLEMAGLASREACDEGYKLGWSSPYAELFARKYFTPRRLADYYVFAREWPDAFIKYKQLEDYERQRPFSNDDHFTLLRLIESFTSLFFKAVGEHIADPDEGPDIENPAVVEKVIENLFFGLEYLFGIRKSKVSCCKLSKDGCWVQKDDRSKLGDTGAKVLLHVQEVCEKGITDEDKLHGPQLPDLSSTKTSPYHWVICRSGNNAHPALLILINDADNPISYQPLRRTAIFRFLRGYRRAREMYLQHRELLRAEQLELQAKRLDLGEHKVMESANEAFLDDDWSWDSVLEKLVAEATQVLPEISRVFVCHKGHRTRGVYPLFFDSKKALERGALVGFEESADLRQRNGGPDKNQNDITVIGMPKNGCRTFVEIADSRRTILVVESSKSLDQKELFFFKKVGIRFSGAATQNLRDRLLRSAMDQRTTPQLFLDRSERIVYANEPAVDWLRLEIDAGWLTMPVPPRDAASKTNVVDALEVIVGYSSEVNSLTERMPGKWVKRCQKILIGNDIAGWSISFHDRAFMLGSFEWFRELEAEKDSRGVLQNMLQRVKELLRSEQIKMRLFLINEKDPDVLRSSLAIGFEDEEKRRGFERGRYTLLRSDREESWRCVDANRPITFVFGEKANEVSFTDRGLELRHVERRQSDPYSEKFEKEADDIWVDVPIYSRTRPRGVLTINFPKKDVEKLAPEVPTLLGALVAVVADILESKDEVEHAIRDTSHEISHQLLRLRDIAYGIGWNEFNADNLPDLKLNLEQRLDQMLRTLTRMPDRIGPIRLRRESCDLVQVVEEAIEMEFPRDLPARKTGKSVQWKRSSGSKETLHGEWDKAHWVNITTELCHNSLDHAKVDELKIEICLSEDAGHLIFTYKDNGQGIPDEKLDRVFNLGVSQRDRRQLGGSGLAFVKKVAIAHSGDVMAISTDGKGGGAHFELRIPFNF